MVHLIGGKSLVISLRVVKAYLGGGLDVVLGECIDIEKVVK